MVVLLLYPFLILGVLWHIPMEQADQHKVEGNQKGEGYCQA